MQSPDLPARGALAEPVPAARPGEAVARTRRLELLALAITRGIGTVNAGFGLAFAFPTYVPSFAGPLLAAAVLTESVTLVVHFRRRGAPSGRWMTVDLYFIATALIVNVLIGSRQGLTTWGFFMYPFSLVAAVSQGVAARRLAHALANGLVLVAGYVAACVIGRIGPFWNLVPDSLTYPAVAAAAFLIAREVRRTAAVLDVSRATAEQVATELGRERERSHYVRLLHDRVLQTVELLAGRDWRLPDEVTAQIRREAVWLRTLVETGEPPHPGDLLSELDAVAARMSGRGLHVVVDAERSAAGELRLTPAVTDALVSAAGEALVNVAKHAGVSSAVVDVRVEDGGLAVAVTDAGVGFTASAVTRGIGLRHSIRRAIEEAGGTVLVDSAPGAGTIVELRVPAGLS